MKHKKKILNTIAAIGLCAILFYSCGASAQTNEPIPSLSGGLQQIWDAASVSTNFAIVTGGGRATSGDKNLAFAEFCYNFNQNVGVIIGYDYLWTAAKNGIPSSANLVKGGITLQAPFRPLKQFGLTNFVATPFAFAVMATGNGSASDVMGTGMQTKIWAYKGIALNTGFIYEKRQDCGYWNGNYVAGFLSVTKGF